MTGVQTCALPISREENMESEYFKYIGSYDQYKFDNICYGVSVIHLRSILPKRICISIDGGCDRRSVLFCIFNWTTLVYDEDANWIRCDQRKSGSQSSTAREDHSKSKPQEKEEKEKKIKHSKRVFSKYWMLFFMKNGVR